MTVSRTLSGQEGVSNKTRQRIQDTMNSLGYRPDRHTRFLELSSNRLIAVVIKGLGNPLFAKILGRMEREIRVHECLTNIVLVPHWSDELNEAVKIVNEESMSGVVFLSAQYGHRAADMEKLRVPFMASTVNWTDSAYRKRYALVSIDNRGEAGWVVDYLYGLGYRRIMLLGSDSLDNSIGSLRLSGYLEAMRHLGLESQSDWVRSFGAIADEPYPFEGGHEMVRDLLAQRLEVAAIFTTADVLAIEALRAARESGRKVPRNLSIVGLDGIPVDKFMYFSLTTIEQPVEKIAEITCDMLLSQLAGDSP